MIIVDLIVWILLNVAISARVRKLRLQNDEIAARFEDVGKEKLWLKRFIR